MKAAQLFTVFLFAGSVVLLLVSGILYLRKDRTPPVLDFAEADILYDRTAEEGALLSGVTARDNRDGDLTDRIVVEKIVVNETQHTAVVYYAVCDAAGNVAKASRQMQAARGEE